MMRVLDYVLLIKLLHIFRLHLVSYIDIGFHGLIVAMTSPLHYDTGRYSLG